MKKGLIAISLAAVIALCGCYGSYAVTNKLYNWNSAIGNKWAKAAVNFVMLIVAYPVCSWLVDGIVLNSIEFWTGSNPVAGNTYYEKDAQGNQVAAVKNADGSLSMQLIDAQGHKADLMLQRDADVIRALDNQGRVIAQYSVPAAK
ncbi:MAG: DUF3332 family protein [Fibrobacteraceae bacterium]